MKHTAAYYEELSVINIDRAVSSDSLKEVDLLLQKAQIYATLAVAAANSPKTLYSDTYFEKGSQK